jgi:hypothetical protein
VTDPLVLHIAVFLDILCTQLPEDGLCRPKHVVANKGVSFFLLIASATGCTKQGLRIIKSRRMRWAGYVARIGEKRNAYRLLVAKPEGNRPL